MSLTRWLVGVKLVNSSSDHWLVGDPKLIPVDILAKVQDVRELPKKSDFEKGDMEHYSTSFRREFRCASSWRSHLIRSAIFGKCYQGTLKSLKSHNTCKIHAHKFQGVFFLRSPKRRRQLGHRHKGLGNPQIDEHSRKSFILVQQMTICHFNVNLLKS